MLLEGFHKHLRSADLRDKLEIGKTYHSSVLLEESIEALDVKSGRWYLDATCGDGGTSLGILKRGGNVIGLDVDPEALGRSGQRFEDEGISQDRYKLIQGNFKDLDSLVKKQMDGVIFDLGVSSLQLETPERGFSFGHCGPLDMRMDPSLEVRAIDLIRVLSRKELYELFVSLGQEKLARPIADALVRASKIGDSTKDLADLVEKVYRQHGIRKWRIHPATKVFQALRIAVNFELDALAEALPKALGLLNKNGSIIVMSFHSLEDRITKDTFKTWQCDGMGQIVNKKLVYPSAEELRVNPRARSAKMRVFKKK